MATTINAYKTPINNTNTDYDILSVRYIVSSDPTFLDATKQLANVLKLKTDSTMMSYTLQHDFSDNLPIYSKVIYSYPNSKTEESAVCRCNPDQLGFSFNNNIISTPNVSIKDLSEHNKVPTGNFTIEVSEMLMFMGHGEHTSTSYRILNSDNKVIFSSIKDEFNLLSIKVPEDTLEENKLYTIEVIQYNNYDSESYTAILVISTSGVYTLYHVDEDSLNLLDNGISTFNYYQNLAGFKYVNINILDSLGNNILENFITSSEQVRLPILNMVAGNRYYVLVRFAFTNHEGEEVFTDTIKMTQICEEYLATDNYYKDYTYNNVFSIVAYDYIDDFFGDINLLKGTTCQLPNGDIPIYKVTAANTIEVRLYTYTGNTLVYTGRSFTVSTTYPIVETEGVNFKLLEDRTIGKDKLFISYIVSNVGVKSNEISSYVYNSGTYGAIDTTVPADLINIPARSLLLSNSTPIIDYTDGTIVFGTIPDSAGDKYNIYDVEKDLDSYSNIVSLYDTNTVINNAISMFPLPDNEILILHTDKSPHTYGLFDRNSDSFINKGSIPGLMQNLASNLALNKFYGYTRLDGRVLLIPNTGVLNNFNIYLYDRYLDEFSELINNKELIIPSKYEDSGLITSRVFSIELNNGNFLALISGVSTGFGSFTDIWEFK